MHDHTIVKFIFDAGCALRSIAKGLINLCGQQKLNIMKKGKKFLTKAYKQNCNSYLPPVI